MADDLTAAEEAELNKFMTTDQTIPPLDEQEGAPAAPTPAPAPTPTPAPAPSPAAPPAPAADPAAPPAGAAPEQTDDEKFAAWQAANAGKTPEELARIAFQQSQRAAREGFENRRSKETLAQIQERVRSAGERAANERQKIADERTAFEKRLAEDPDAATKDLHERQMTEREAAVERDEFTARQDAAIGLASQAVPDFHERAPAVYAFGGEMGYSQQELAGISDGRDLVVLSLADMAARLIKGGMMDMKGNLLAGPTPVETTDPRLTAPTPVPTLSSTPARPTSSGKNVTQQATDILNMSDADFARLPPAELEALQRQLEG